MNESKITLGEKTYTVKPPYGQNDTNYHFIDDDGNDYLVDIWDAMEWFELEDGVSMQNVIDFATEIHNYHECDWYWKVV